MHVTQIHRNSYCRKYAGLKNQFSISTLLLLLFKTNGVMRKFFSGLLAGYCLFLFACNNSTTAEVQSTSDTATIDGHPAWIEQGNVYEVNTRQYTPEGTFKAFEQHLDRLKEMGVQTLWFMPINPISQKDRKGKLGSYYAVSSYTAINPEYGTMDDWKALVKEAHAKGFKVIIDWVPNHTGADHPWLTTHPDFYVKDSTGKPAVAFDWDDVRQLDYQNPEMQDSMIASMRYWITNSDIDGFRCDVAWNVPGEFWKKCIEQLKQTKRSLFFLAEGEKPYLVQNGFDAFYPWEEFHMMVKVAKGERPAFALDSIQNKYDTTYFPQSLALYFTSNHDENSWNGTEYEKYDGGAKTFAVFCCTWHGIPLIYSGQELPNHKRLKFFDKDQIDWNDRIELHNFYKSLLELKSNNKALHSHAEVFELTTGHDEKIFSYLCVNDSCKVLVLLNLSSDDRRHCIITHEQLSGNYKNLFSGIEYALKETQNFELQRWEYFVYYSDGSGNN